MGKPVFLLTGSVVDPDGRTLPPLLYLREDDNLIVCNVKPPSERWNPWPLNVRAHPKVTVRIKGVAERRVAHEAGSEEIEELWPRLVALWPPSRVSLRERTSAQSSCSKGRDGMPTALDNGQRSPRKLLAEVVRKLVLALKRT
jgi:hypothetical protein